MEILENTDLIDELTKKFQNSLPKEEQKLVEEFRKYLNSVVMLQKNNDNKFNIKGKDYSKKVLNRITNRFVNYDLDSKKRMLLPDASFEKIKIISNEIYKTAKYVSEGNEYSLSFSISDRINELEKILDTVEDYNKTMAKMMVSETALDLYFIKNPNTKIRSFRLARKHK